jgi:alkanesulfonate monooxygenase SsuD/methylene tetrahydromethanopterin reductase-like flavin-dependent oxidoreductase (luciferase family)
VSPEKARAHAYDEADRARIEAMRRRAFVGTGDAVIAKLRALAAELALDELVVNTWTFDHAARVRSYELLAQANAR